MGEVSIVKIIIILNNVEKICLSFKENLENLGYIVANIGFSS